MKKIIKNKAYDTDTAKAVGRYDDGLPHNDFDHIDETLYRKRNGEFFLYGSGGARTVYGKSCGDNNWCGGESIIPLSAESAQSWAEDHMTADAYESIFGVVPDDDTKKLVNFTISVSAHEKGKRAAAAAGVSLSALVSDYLEGM